MKISMRSSNVWHSSLRRALWNPLHLDFLFLNGLVSFRDSFDACFASAELRMYVCARGIFFWVCDFSFPLRACAYGANRLKARCGSDCSARVRVH
jgi:hypothetical protein